MNSTDAEPGIESELIDLDGIPFSRLRDSGNELLYRSMRQVVERTAHVRALYPSSNATGGERID